MPITGQASTWLWFNCDDGRSLVILNLPTSVPCDLNYIRSATLAARAVRAMLRGHDKVQAHILLELGKLITANDNGHSKISVRCRW